MYFFFTLEKPTLLPLILPYETVHVHTYVQLTCVVSAGDLPIDFTWLLNGRRLKTSAQLGYTSVVVSHQTSLLIIANVGIDQAGNYTCLVNNSAGHASTSIQVKVNGNLMCLETVALFAIFFSISSNYIFYYSFLLHIPPSTLLA